MDNKEKFSLMRKKKDQGNKLYKVNLTMCVYVYVCVYMCVCVCVCVCGMLLLLHDNDIQCTM